MAEYTVRDPVVPPLEVTRRPRTQPIRQIQWHATRGNTSLDRQVAATEHWFGSPANDRGGWGASADFVVGPDYRKPGEIVIVQFGRWWETFSSWSAGYGGPGTLGAAEYGVAIEVAQSPALEDYSAELIDACVWLVRHINEGLRTLGAPEIPPRHLAGWDQRADAEVPGGHIGHDELANGVKLGKTDPGSKFPWARLMRLLAPAPAPPPPTYEDGVRAGTSAVLDALSGFMVDYRKDHG